MQALVDEVGRFERPVVRTVSLFKDDLLCEELHPVRNAVETLVRSATLHHLEAEDPHREEVRLKGMVLTEEDLRGHVSRRATGVRRVLWLPQPGISEVNEPYVTMLVNDQV